MVKSDAREGKALAKGFLKILAKTTNSDGVWEEFAKELKDQAEYGENLATAALQRFELPRDRFLLKYLTRKKHLDLDCAKLISKFAGHTTGCLDCGGFAGMPECEQCSCTFCSSHLEECEPCYEDRRYRERGSYLDSDKTLVCNNCACVICGDKRCGEHSVKCAGGCGENICYNEGGYGGGWGGYGGGWQFCSPRVEPPHDRKRHEMRDNDYDEGGYGGGWGYDNNPTCPGCYLKKNDLCYLCNGANLQLGCFCEVGKCTVCKKEICNTCMKQCDQRGTDCDTCARVCPGCCDRLHEKNDECYDDDLDFESMFQGFYCRHCKGTFLCGEHWALDFNKNGHHNCDPTAKRKKKKKDEMPPSAFAVEQAKLMKAEKAQLTQESKRFAKIKYSIVRVVEKGAWAKKKPASSSISPWETYKKFKPRVKADMHVEALKIVFSSDKYDWIANGDLHLRIRVLRDDIEIHCELFKSVEPRKSVTKLFFTEPGDDSALLSKFTPGDEIAIEFKREYDSGNFGYRPTEFRESFSTEVHVFKKAIDSKQKPAPAVRARSRKSRRRPAKKKRKLPKRSGKKVKKRRT